MAIFTSPTDKKYVTELCREKQFTFTYYNTLLVSIFIIKYLKKA